MPRFSNFWHLNDQNFLTPMYMDIFFAQILVKPLFSHLNKAGFLMMRVICKQITQDMKGYISSKNSIQVYKKLFLVCEVEILQVTVNKIEVYHLCRLISGDFLLKVPKIAQKGTLVSCHCS